MIGGTTALAALTVNGATSLGANTTSVRTTGYQIYNGTLALGANTTLTTTNALVDIEGNVNSSTRTLALSSGSGGAVFDGLTLTALNTAGTTGQITLNIGTYAIGAAGATDVFGTGTAGVVLDGNITLSRATTFSAPVTLGGNTTLNGSSGVTLTGNVTGPFNFIAANEPITLTQTSTTINTSVGNGAVSLGNVSNTGKTLTVSTGSGNTSFAGLTLGAFTLNSTGTETLNAGTYNITAGDIFGFGGAGAIPVITNGALVFSEAATFSGPVTLGSTTTITDSAGTVGFLSTVDATTSGGQGLIVSGNASFGGVVGGNKALSSLSVTGTTGIANNITTAGTQTYTGAVTLNGNATLTTTNALVTLGQVTGAGDTLTLTTGTAGETFNGLTLAALSLVSTTGTETISTGTYNISGGNIFGATNAGTVAVKTNGTLTLNQPTTFTSAVTLGSATTLAGSGGTTFDSTVNGAFALSIGTSGGTTFEASVGGSTALTSLGITGAASFVSASSQQITTSGNQAYSGAVTLGATTTFQANNGSGTATFGSTIDSVFGRPVFRPDRGRNRDLRQFAGLDHRAESRDGQ